MGRLATGVIVGLVIGVCCTAAMADEGQASSVWTGLEGRPVAVIEELRHDLQASLRTDLLAAMRLQMGEAAAVVKANTLPSELQPEWELAGQAR